MRFLISPIIRLLDRLARRMPSFQRLAGQHRELAGERDELVHQRGVLVEERDSLAQHAKRLAGEAEDHARREEEWKRERKVLLTQRDALETERDELSGHAAHLEANLSEAHQREKELSSLLAQTKKRHDELLAERNDLKHRHTELKKEWDEINRLLPFPPGHFYSPIVDPSSPQALRAVEDNQRIDGSALQGIRASDEAMKDWFTRISRHYGEIPFPEAKSPDYRYYFDNPAFSDADAVTLFGMLLEHKPRRLIEVGAGHSSCLILDTVERFLGGETELTFIDPYPDVLLGLLEPDDPARSRIRATPIQDVPTELFFTLEQGDILFLDTSHVAKTGSDVNHYLFEILPALRPGVVVHIHDIFYPFEYSDEWIRQECRSWNEAYILRAFLQYNQAFEVIFFNNYYYRRRTQETRSKMPRCLTNPGGSLWLRKTE